MNRHRLSFQNYFNILFFILALTAMPLLAGIAPTDLTCEYLTNPQVVDILQPRLSWINVADADERGQQQTAWQIRVSTNAEAMDKADLWDSGKIKSDQSFRVNYAGKELTSRQECWWQVRVWDKKGKVSEWSEPGFWRMGLLNKQDWQAEWIGAPWQGEEPLPKPQGGPDALPTEMPPPAPLLRKAFSVDKEISSAVAFVTGLGYFELYANGTKVGDDELVPNQTNYGKRPELMQENIPIPDNFRDYKVMYLAYDLKDYLKKGKNVIGAILGNGFYNAPKYWVRSYGSPRFIGQIHITYTDGSEEVITSDASWKASKSAIVKDLVYHGEIYDARLEQPGWSTTDFDAQSWQPVAIRKAPEGRLVAHTAHTDKVTKRLQPVSIVKKDSVYHVEFGEEISGRIRFHNIQGPEGQEIQIKYLSNLYSGDHTYICNGGKPSEYASRFNWFVFKDVEILNWPGELTADMLTAEAVNTYIDETAVFETSNPLFNDINKIWRRSQLDNMHGGIASDCPHRERAAYTGDGQVACVTVMHNYDATNFYHKWIQDIFAAQNPETGYVPNGAPWEPGCGGGVAWGAAICIMPWEFYLHYGDTEMLDDNYEGMKGYIGHMQNWVDDDGIMFQQMGKDGRVIRWFNLGEWAMPGTSIPDDLVHTFYFWRCADFTAKTAAVLGHDKDAAEYAELAEQTRSAFFTKFYNAETGSCGTGGGDIFALKMGAPDSLYDNIIAAVRKNIADNDGHLDTGIFGTQFFFEILAENGMNDLAFHAMNKRTEPGYGYWLELGATTTREHWNSRSSHNHPMFGGGLVWLYRKLAGMQVDEAEPGYKHIIFRPQVIDDLEHVTYSNKTSLGKAGITWKNENAVLRMDVTVPVGSYATVFVPATEKRNIVEKTADRKNFKFQGMQDGYAVYQVQSGDYHFAVNR